MWRNTLIDSMKEEKKVINSQRGSWTLHGVESGAGRRPRDADGSNRVKLGAIGHDVYSFALSESSTRHGLQPPASCTSESGATDQPWGGPR